MNTDSQTNYPAGDYFPHILSGAGARRQSGRRSPGLNKPSGCYPWYTTYMIDQGPFTLKDADANTLQGEGPAVVCLPPLPKERILIPSSTLFSWIEWGAVRLPLCPRDRADASRKYPEGLEQPGPAAVWGRPMPLQLPASCNRPTAGMMVRVNACWWKGGADRMLANAELALWIARYLFPPEVRDDHLNVRNLFPNADPEFLETLELLNSSYDMGLDIRDWALAAGMSPRSLQRHCKQETGLSPQGVLDALRIERAERLLRDPNNRLLAVSRSCGFAGISAFSTWFSKKKGISPGRWRAGFRE